MRWLTADLFMAKPEVFFLLLLFFNANTCPCRQMVQSQAGRFTGNVIIFIDLAPDVVRFSNLPETTQGVELGQQLATRPSPRSQMVFP